MSNAEPLAYAMIIPASTRIRNYLHGISVVLDKKRPTSRRFALARIIGDHFYSQHEDHILPSTSAKTVRQKFQRAFAQAFLCPFDALASIIGDHVSDNDTIEDAAAIFEVSPLLVTTILVNKGVLERGELSNLNADYILHL